jgi:hypothetical protein
MTNETQPYGSMETSMGTHSLEDLILDAGDIEFDHVRRNPENYLFFKALLEEFIIPSAPESHTERNFVQFLITVRLYSREGAKDILDQAIKMAALHGCALEPYVAVALSDASFPITIDLLEKTLFPALLYLDPSAAKFMTAQDYRTAEAEHFAEVTKLIVTETKIVNWIQNEKGKTLTKQQLKARRIWHRGSVLTWSPYLRSILNFALQAMTSDERERLLYRESISDHQWLIVKNCLHRLFSHPLWDEPEGEVDCLFVSSKKQDDYFAKKGLTEKYVINGVSQPD